MKKYAVRKFIKELDGKKLKAVTLLVLGLKTPLAERESEFTKTSSSRDYTILPQTPNIVTQRLPHSNRHHIYQPGSHMPVTSSKLEKELVEYLSPKELEKIKLRLVKIRLKAAIAAESKRIGSYADRVGVHLGKTMVVRHKDARYSHHDAGNSVVEYSERVLCVRKGQGRVHQIERPDYLCIQPYDRGFFTKSNKLHSIGNGHDVAEPFDVEDITFEFNDKEAKEAAIAHMYPPTRRGITLGDILMGAGLLAEEEASENQDPANKVCSLPVREANQDAQTLLPIEVNA